MKKKIKIDHLKEEEIKKWGYTSSDIEAFIVSYNSLPSSMSELRQFSENRHKKDKFDKIIKEKQYKFNKGRT